MTLVFRRPVLLGHGSNFKPSRLVSKLAPFRGPNTSLLFSPPGGDRLGDFGRKSMEPASMDNICFAPVGGSWFKSVLGKPKWVEDPDF